ncbi:MAG: HAMP domain-containing histidine kinase [Firmicutes bacterium]|jgi:two-component system OmpR family sensor kinase|uniref:histidine kinase n=1 Tax=Sulfobacillus benefaciens TaxID=453960 RepID=A0A2T2X846_9FIRM|nr:HAMP domain-containing histidine kinase [Bacillota bacterium]MCL5012553.1 HAMP domain-containing histidine kinase [Bacillota bacterium]PSR30681.1 MAG: sensor histidine kinase [Sulfobacillus benefaciens]
MAQKTLTDELIGRQILLLAILLVIIGISQYLTLRFVLFHSESQSLHQEIAVLAPIIHHAMVKHEALHFHALANLLVARLQAPGVDVVITNRFGLLVASSSPLTKIPPLDFSHSYFLWHHYLVVDAPLGSAGHPSGYVWLLTSTASSSRILARDIELFTFLGFLSLVVTGWLGSLSVKNSLVPLKQIRDSTVRIAEGEIGHTTMLKNPPKELGELGDAINAMSLSIKDLLDHERMLSEQMRRFVADASHELRTPLTALNGFLTLMSEDNLTEEEIQRGFQAMRQEARRMARLVNQLLTLSRLDTALEAAVQISPVSLDEWLNDSVPLLEPITRNHSLSISSEPVTVTADKDRLTEMLLNLVDNATRYTPWGSAITVEIKQEGSYGLIQVMDDGPGIKEEDLPHIFDRFFRGDRSRTSKSGGSGLGLSIVQALAQAMNGVVEVYNRQPPQHGAIFVIKLPVTQVLP